MNNNFIKNPYLLLSINKSLVESTKDLFIMFFFTIISLFCFSIILGPIDLFLIKEYNFSFLKTIIKVQNESNFSFLYIVILGPFLEEIIFRLPLVINWFNLSISFLIGFIYFLYIKNKGVIFDFSVFDFNTIIFLILYFSFLIFIFFSRKRINGRIYTLYFYALILIFGFLHIYNFFNLTPKYLTIIAPIFTIPQIILGFFSSYLRIQNGFIWGVLLHMIYNSLSLVL